jgi:mRNA-degrading endonuclease RelE of RelBE toxin-antitoxin system
VSPRGVVWSRAAERDLRRLDRQVAERVRATVLHFAATAHGDVRKLEARPGQFALRVGDWRALFRDYDADAIEIIGVLPRGRAYHR